MGSIYHNGIYYGGGGGGGGVNPDMDSLVLKDGRVAINFATEFSKEDNSHAPTTGMVAEALEVETNGLRTEFLGLRATKTNYGLAKTTDVTTVTNPDNGLVLSAVEKNPNFVNGLAYQIAQIKGIQNIQEFTYPLASHIVIEKDPGLRIPDFKLSIQRRSLIFGYVELHILREAVVSDKPCGEVGMIIVSGNDNNRLSDCRVYYPATDSPGISLQASVNTILEQDTIEVNLSGTESITSGGNLKALISSFSKAHYIVIPLE